MGKSSSSRGRKGSKAAAPTIGVYRFGAGPEDRDWVGWDSANVDLGLRFGRGRIPEDFEFPPLRRLELEGRLEELGDVPVHQVASVLCVSERALNALLSFLTKEDQVFPLRSRYGRYYAINVLRYVDCLNARRSKAEWAERYERAFAIYEFAFRARTIPRAAIFRVPEAPGYILLTETVADALDAVGADGYVLYHLGDVEPSP
jgi:hypothetical protein